MCPPSNEGTGQLRPDACAHEYRRTRVHKEARLIRGGYDVVVRPGTGRETTPEEDVERVHVHRVRTGNVQGQLSLVLNYPLFLLRALREAGRVRPDAVHAHDLDTFPVGLLISRLRRIPLVFDAHERYAGMIALDIPLPISRRCKERGQDGAQADWVSPSTISGEGLRKLPGTKCWSS